MATTRIRAERQRLGLSLRRFIPLVGIAAPDQSRIERGLQVPTKAQLERLAAVLNVPAAELLKDVVADPE